MLISWSRSWVFCSSVGGSRRVAHHRLRRTYRASPGLICLPLTVAATALLAASAAAFGASADLVASPAGLVQADEHACGSEDEQES
ncbi:MAG: hypothetical protein MZV65_49155 [Chromatiales bacterium]|nr:hypothetical protein [Chromatiales bacterium]